MKHKTIFLAGLLPILLPLAGCPHMDGDPNAAAGDVVWLRGVSPDWTPPALSAPVSGTQFPAVAIPFKVKGEAAVTSVKLKWQPQSGATAYVIERNGAQAGIASGDTFDDYGLTSGTTYTYVVKACAGSSYLSRSVDVQTQAFTPAGSPLATKDNHNQNNGNIDVAAATSQPSGFLFGSTWYKYTSTTIGADSARHVDIAESKSSDGKTGWSTPVVIHTITASGTTWGSNTDNAGSNLEGAVFHKVGNKVVLSGHYERGADYNVGLFYLAHITPEAGSDGKALFEEKYRGRPASLTTMRDQSIFTDDDGTTYVLAAANGNTDMAICKIIDDWTSIELTALVFVSQYRETPYIVKYGDTYFFFTSRASGWYPSQTKYITAKSMAGPWETTPRDVVNQATFGAQFNAIGTYPSTQRGNTYGVIAYRWAANWGGNSDVPPVNYPRLFPLFFSGNFAAADWFREFEYYSDWGLVPVQSGRFLSLGAAVKVPDSKAAATALIDGACLASSPSYAYGTVPYDIVIDLGAPHKINEVNLSTYLIGGSETVFFHTIYGANNPYGINNLLADASGYSKVGYMTHAITDTTPYRYIKVHVINVRDIAHGSDVNYFNSFYEIAVLGE